MIGPWLHAKLQAIGVEMIDAPKLLWYKQWPDLIGIAHLLVAIGSSKPMTMTLSGSSRKMDDRVQLYKVQVAATMELCGKIVWQQMAHVAWPVQCIAREKW